MEDGENLNKLTFSNYFGAVKRFKWWVLGATAVSTLAGYLLVNFWVNKNREQLKSEFSYSINLHTDKLPDNSDISYGELTKYLADNSIYDYSDIISGAHLDAVKQSKEEYKNINTKALLESGAIQLERMAYTDSVTGKTIPLYPERYSLTVKASFFKNASQGKAFIKDLIDYELVIASKANNSYEIPYYINDSFASMSLNDKLSLLDKQYNIVDETYKTLLKEFAEGSLVSENTTLGNRYNSFHQSNSSGAFTKFGEMKDEYYLYHYVTPGVDTPESLIYKAEEYKNNIKDSLISISVNEASLENLIQTTTIITNAKENELQEKILELTEDINEEKMNVYNYANELKNLGYLVPANSTEITLNTIENIVLNDATDAEGSIQYLQGKNTPANWEENCLKFVTKVNESVPGLQKDTNDCTSSYHFLYNTYKNRANYYTTNFAVLQNSFNPIYGLIIGLVAGYVVSSLIVMAIHINTPNKKEK